MDEHHLRDFVLKINPATFDPSLHHGHRVVVSESGRVSIYEPRLFDRLLGHRKEGHYFVMHWVKPKKVDHWTFRWSDGTSPVGLDFDARFQIQANEELQACQLVNALRHAEPGESLYRLIDRCLDEALSLRLQSCQADQVNLLAQFRSSSIGVGESEALNRDVGKAVSAALGATYFAIGFTLKNQPPMQVEIKQEDKFVLPDSQRERTVVTHARLDLDNYQAFRKSGLDNEDQVKAAIGAAITRAVRTLMFRRTYYSIVKSFSNTGDTLEDQMSALIAPDARTIGYRIGLFHSFPDIAALQLLREIRIDLPASESRYSPANSVSYVQVEVTLSVRAEDFDRLPMLLEPDDPDLLGKIRQKVSQICKDQIQRIGYMDFNLRFEEQVKPRLADAIVKGLRAYGLSTTVINVVQAPTEEAVRFNAICGEAIEFKLAATPRAEFGDADEVEVFGTIEVTGMAPEGWERFERKDFGFCRDSTRTEAEMRRLALANEIELSPDTPLPEDERRALAIRLELVEIRKRVVATLREALSSVPDLARSWTTFEMSRRIIEGARTQAATAVAHEFGLAIELRGMNRGDTITEATRQSQRLSQHELLRQAAQIDREHELVKLEAASLADREFLADASQLDRAALNDESQALPQHLGEKLARERASAAQRITLQGAAKVLAVRSARRSAGPADERLPWESVPAPPPTPDGAAD